MTKQLPNVLFVMTDQQRFDTIAAMGNHLIHTPNLDRLVHRGVACTRAYSPCPVCIPARYVIRTGCEPARTACFCNDAFSPESDQADDMEERCGPFLARRMTQLGYRTFGIGKFHSRHPYLGYDTYLWAEELWATPQGQAADSYVAFLRREHPQFDFIEQPHGERSEMYYMPQCGPLPAELTYETWAANQAVDQIAVTDDRPYFGFVSMIGPHPPCAPPIPYNRLYDPDRMPEPVLGDLSEDHADARLPFVNHAMWAEEISPMQARAIKARYYGEITFIDACIGRILDAVETSDDADNTLIAFFSDHGDHLGDHHAWQKESFFESSCHIPMLVSWPAKLLPSARYDGLVGLTDLFALATGAAGRCETRDGIDLLAAITGVKPGRDALFGAYGIPGTPEFKMMVLHEQWKYIFLSNGGREQLFDLAADSNELVNRAADLPDICRDLRNRATDFADRPGTRRALNEQGRLQTFAFQPRSRRRVVQMARERGVSGFPDTAIEVLAHFEPCTSRRRSS